MFGVMGDGRLSLSCREHVGWWSHVCGSCLALGKAGGQAARVATNYDTALLSVLWDAMSDEPLPRVRHVCPLRGFRALDVVDASSGGAKLAAATAMLGAAIKVRDHLRDGDSWLGRLGWLFADVADTWRRLARRAAGRLGFDTADVEGQARAQDAVEASGSRRLDDYCRPTEEAVASACAQAARALGRAENVVPLRDLGRAFGRIVYVVDAWRDYDRDRRKGAFNPLAACFGARDRSAVKAVIEAAVHALAGAFDRLVLVRPEPARTLLLGELPAVLRRELADPLPALQIYEPERLRKSTEAKQKAEWRAELERRGKAPPGGGGGCCSSPPADPPPPVSRATGAAAGASGVLLGVAAGAAAGAGLAKEDAGKQEEQQGTVAGAEKPEDSKVCTASNCCDLPCDPQCCQGMCDVGKNLGELCGGLFEACGSCGCDC